MLSAGQWLGRSMGNPNGSIMIDLDENDDGSRSGWIYLYTDNELFSSCVRLDRILDASTLNGTFNIDHFDPKFGVTISPAELRQKWPNEQYPNQVTITANHLSDEFCVLTWQTEIGTHGTATLERSRLHERSSIIPETLTWLEFKLEVAKQKQDRIIYRGQNIRYPLQSSFHRTKRKCLQSYVNNDLQLLHRATSGATRHVFKLEYGQEKGALLALAQHHGFPTPLIDWSFSPYVAAWFAFEKARMSHDPKDEDVCIFMLDRAALHEFGSSVLLTHSYPHISSLETLAIENPRLYPQQGVSTLTNLHDVEKHIVGLEAGGRKLLRAISLPIAQRSEILAELRLMGITKGTLFPGLDGICSDLKDKLFN